MPVSVKRWAFTFVFFYFSSDWESVSIRLPI